MAVHGRAFLKSKLIHCLGVANQDLFSSDESDFRLLLIRSLNYKIWIKFIVFTYIIINLNVKF